MVAKPVPGRRPTRQEWWWALARLALGLAQMAGAVAAVGLLLGSGPTALALGAVVFTCLCTTLSVLLFGGRR